MFNVIRMELVRMFKTRSFYITIAVCALFMTGMLYILSPVMNQAFEASEGQSTSAVVSQETEDGWTVAMNIADTSVACPNNVCSSFISYCVLFVVIFIACFVGEFYKNGFCKNVLGKVRHKYYFQAAKLACVMVYTAIIMSVTVTVSLITANCLINSFEFVYMKEFAMFLLGEYCLLSVIGLASAFITELSGSKIPAIIYIVLCSTNIIASLVGAANDKLSELLSTEILIEDYLPSLYQLKFQTEIPSNSFMENSNLIRALVLSFVAFVVYNIIGSVLITKRDVK